MVYDKKFALERILSTSQIKIGEIICGMGTGRLLEVVEIVDEKRVLVKKSGKGRKIEIKFGKQMMYHKYKKQGGMVIVEDW